MNSLAIVESADGRSTHTTTTKPGCLDSQLYRDRFWHSTSNVPEFPATQGQRCLSLFDLQNRLHRRMERADVSEVTLFPDGVLPGLVDLNQLRIEAAGL